MSGLRASDIHYAFDGYMNHITYYTIVPDDGCKGGIIIKFLLGCLCAFIVYFTSVIGL